MGDPAFYPHQVTRLERRETHISVVFLTGSVAYKLKKPIDFGFLDYTGLETRRRMCELEVCLNQRLSAGIYEGVVAICEEGGRFRFGEMGDAVEYAVKMKQLPDDASLSNQLGAGGISHDDMKRLGLHLADFYSRSERNPEIDRYGRAETISLNMEENFRQLEPFVPGLVERNQFEFVREASRGFFRDQAQLFDRRIAEGRICDGHGDLRAEHVYFLDRIQIIDCIEFNERFRYGDAAIDLAFLHMDMERLGHDDLSLAMMKAYTDASHDWGIYALLDFYSCYRAIVKMKVACLNWTELDEGARKGEMEIRAAQYLDLAARFAVQFVRPSLVIVCGLPGSGKSTLSKRLRDLFDTKLFMSDDVRRELPEYWTQSGSVSYGQGMYRPEVRGRVYAHLLNLAREELKKGRSVILDATFTRRKWREEAVRLALDADSNILFFECTSANETLLARLGRRRSREDSLSDARPEHLPGLRVEFESMDELAPEQHATVSTESEIESSLNEILARAYAMKRAQVVQAVAKL